MSESKVSSESVSDSGGACWAWADARCLSSVTVFRQAESRHGHIHLDEPITDDERPGQYL
jgi:hypothetical protein